jgi:hypothetical protein
MQNVGKSTRSVIFHFAFANFAFFIRGLNYFGDTGDSGERMLAGRCFGFAHDNMAGSWGRYGLWCGGEGGGCWWRFGLAADANGKVARRGIDMTRGD